MFMLIALHHVYTQPLYPKVNFFQLLYPLALQRVSSIWQSESLFFKHSHNSNPNSCLQCTTILLSCNVIEGVGIWAKTNTFNTYDELTHIV